ncbi:MAG: hypothetical protein L3J73_02760 [Thermoplasmata archaeon]|nr:hypothetical protein [Thermoplasmata archaeon]
MSKIIKTVFRGARVDVPVCWTEEQCAAVAAAYPPDGIVDLEDQHAQQFSDADKALLKQMALTLLAKQRGVSVLSVHRDKKEP